MSKKLAVILVAIMCFLGVPCSAWAYSGTVSLEVGKSTTLYTKYTGSGTLTSALWSSNSPSVSIESQSSGSCRIKANSYTSLPVVVDCHYYYTTSSYVGGKKTYHNGSGYTSYTINVKESGDSVIVTDDSLSASVSNMTLGMGEGAKTIKLTSGSTLSSTVYIKENSSSGKCVSLESQGISGNTQTYYVYPNSIGTQTVTFQLIKKTGTNSSSIVKKVTVKFTVSCSHVYDDGVVTVEPTVDHTGVKTYTCVRCNQTKTEVIPKLEPSDPEEGTTEAEPEEGTTEVKPEEDTTTEEPEEGTTEVKPDEDTTEVEPEEDTTEVEEPSTESGEETVNTEKKGVTGVTASEQYVELTQGEAKEVYFQVQTNAACSYTYHLEQDTEAFSACLTSQTSSEGRPLKLYGNEAGEGTLTISIIDFNTKETLADTEIRIKVIESLEEDETKPVMGEITLDVDSIELKKGESQTVSMTLNQGLPVNCSYGCCCMKGLISSNFKQGAEDGEYTVTITGTRCGSGNIEFYVKNVETKEYISKVTIPVTVNP